VASEPAPKEHPRVARPRTPEGFDPSRPHERAADPAGWRLSEGVRAALAEVIAARRDIRRFRPDPVPDDVLGRLLAAAHRAPSVGLMQPWRLIVVRSLETRRAVRRIAQRERLRQAERFVGRGDEFLDQKIEGIVEAPLGICVCCDNGEPGSEVLGRGTIPETAQLSVACAIQNLWLTARAEGLGVGWVSFYRYEDLRALLGIPERVDPVAWLCVGWPDERPPRPGLEAAGWGKRLPLDVVVMEERWDRERGEAARAAMRQQRPGPTAARPAAVGAGAGNAAGRRATSPQLPDGAAQTAVRDLLDELVKPPGGLGRLEELALRWAGITGAPPPERPKWGVLVACGDHGHVRHGSSLFEQRVSSEVAAAAARRATAVGALAAALDHELLVADIGLALPTPPGVTDTNVRRGTRDMTTGAALTSAEVDEAIECGRRLARELLGRGCAALALGEIGIGNTATSAAIAALALAAPVEAVVGRGAAMDAPGLERKRRVVAAAVARHQSKANDPVALLAACGGLEHCALCGALLAAAEARVPVLLDGFSVGVAALVACSIDPAVWEVLIASHRSAEPGHGLVLRELGLEPLLELRLRAGEGAGAVLAARLVEATGAALARMATFAGAGVTRSLAAESAARSERVDVPHVPLAACSERHGASTERPVGAEQPAADQNAAPPPSDG
jgi:nicotinate-nucleotide--dimethylbenzimidazole phosphoribosyltransferase